MVSSELGEELLHSLSAVFSSNRQCPFRLLFYRATTGQAQEVGNLEEVREKRDLGRSRLAVFSFLCLESFSTGRSECFPALDNVVTHKAAIVEQSRVGSWRC